MAKKSRSSSEAAIAVTLAAVAVKLAAAEAAVAVKLAATGAVAAVAGMISADAVCQFAPQIASSLTSSPRPS